MAVTSSKAVGLLLLLSTMALCQASPNGNNVTERIVQGIKDVTDMSDNLRIATSQITVWNAPQQGSVIAQGFTTIVVKIAHGIEKMNSVTTGSLPDADAQLVVDALTTFVHVHQALLNVVIGKHGIVTLVPFFEPIRIALVSLEAVIDSFALDLIGLIPTQKPAAQKQFDDLAVTLKDAQATYSLNREENAKLSNTPTTDKVLQGIGNVTAMSNTLRVATLQITIWNAPQQGFIIAQGFTGIIAKIAEGIARVDSVTSGPLPDADAQLVVDALTTFVHVHQALLNVVIGKHGIATLVPFFEPIRIALVSLEAVIDSFALDLIGLIPTQKPAAQKQFDDLGVTLKDAQATYSYNLDGHSTLSNTPTTDKVLQGIGNVTAMSNTLRVATLQITIWNAPQQGFIIAQGFTGIIAKIAEGIARVDSVTSGPLPDADAQLVVDALTTFVHVHQALLNVVIGKHGIATLVPFFEPIRIALVSLEAVIDSFALDLIGLIPTQKPAAQKQFDDLGVTLKDAQATYSYNLDGHSKLSNTPTTDKVLQGIGNVTAMSNTLRVATLQITIWNAPQQGFIIAQGFTGIIAKIAEGIARVDSVTSGPLPDADAQLVVDALTTFVHVHQALLNVVIGKHGIATLVPFFEPIRIALVSLEAVIDSFALDLIGLIPTQKPAAQKQFDDLGVTLKDAQATYSYNLDGHSKLSNTPTTDKVLQGIGNVTAMSDTLRVATLQITIWNAPQQGFIIAQGFTGIIAKIAEGIARVDSVTSGPLPDADAQLVVDALTTFVHVHQALLNVVIGKHGIATLVPFFEPIRIALVSLEAVIDSFALDLIGLIPTQKPAAQKQFDDLGVTLKDAQATYSYNLDGHSKLSNTPTTDKVLQGIGNVTAMSDTLRVATLQITIWNAPQQGFIIAQGFTGIIAKIAEGIARVDSVTSGPLPDADAQLVVDALTTFVHVHQALLNVVIGKHGIATLVPFFEPIRIALVSLEAVIDSFALDLIGLIPTQKPAAQQQFDDLAVTLKDAQTTYSVTLASVAKY